MEMYINKGKSSDTSEVKTIDPKKLKLIGYVSLGIAIAILTLSFFSFQKYLIRNVTYRKVEGTVQSYNTDRHGKMAPIIEYEANGQFYEKASSDYKDIPPRIGMVYEILYNPKHPERAYWATDQFNYFVPFLALPFLVVAIYIFRLRVIEFINKQKEKMASRPKKEKPPKKEKIDKKKDNKDDDHKNKKGNDGEEKPLEKEEYDGPPLVVFTENNPEVPPEE